MRIDPNSSRPELGPDSAGARIGVCWPEGGLETVTVTDLNLVLGRVNPDYFLGGDVKLDTERARAAVERADRRAARASASSRRRPGSSSCSTRRSSYEAVAQVLGKGYSPVDYTLLCYGGGGPLHVAGYTDGVPLPRRARADLGGGLLGLRLRLRRLRLPLRPDDRPADRADADDDEKAGHRACSSTAAGEMLRERVVDEFAKSRHRPTPRSSSATTCGCSTTGS